MLRVFCSESKTEGCCSGGVSEVLVTGMTGRDSAVWSEHGRGENHEACETLTHADRHHPLSHR